jgi:cobalt/nickel transport system ATP-binding protein
MSHHLLELIDVHYRYHDGTAALEGVNLRLTHGEAVALVGANGAGKSTLLLLLAGCLLPTTGQARVGDVPVTSKTLPTIRRAVGLLMQDPDDQLFMATVGQDVAFGPANLRLPPEEIEARVARALEAVGAGHLRDRPPYRLSGGEKRLAAMAAVLAMGPDVLLLDEPSASLDPRARRRAIEILRGFHHTRLVATHDLDLALDVCERTVILSHGKVAADGPTAEILRDAALLDRCGLELPLSLQGR